MGGLARADPNQSSKARECNLRERAAAGSLDLPNTGCRVCYGGLNWSKGESDMSKSIVALMLLSFTALAACNTVSGIGEDIQAGGTVIEETAEEVRTSTY